MDALKTATRKFLALAPAILFTAAMLLPMQAQAACPFDCTDLNDNMGGGGGATGPINTTGNTLNNNIAAGSTYGAVGGNVISGTGASGVSVVITNSGNTGQTFTLAGTHTYTGSTTVSTNAILALTSSNAIASSASVLDNGTIAISGTTQTLNALSGGGSITSSGGALTVGGGGSSTFSGVYSGTNSTLTVTGSGTNLILSGVNTYTGATVVNSGATLSLGANNDINTSASVANAGTILIGGSTSQTLHILSGAGGIAISSGGLLTENGTASYSGVISGSGAVATAGSGNWTLSGVHTYTGATTVGSGSTLTLTGTNNITSSSSVTVTGTLAMGGTTQTLNRLAGAGSITSSGGALTAAGGATSAFSGVYSGTGSTLTVSGSGTNLQLGGVNTYTGGTTVNSGATLSLTSNNNINTSASVANAGTILISGGTSQTLQVLSGAGGIAISASALLTETGTATYSGVISGSGAVSTATSGTWTLTGTNTYTGATTVGSGTTLVDNGTIDSSVGGLTINSGGTLKGTGTVIGSVTNNGNLLPGNSIGTITVGDYTQGSGGTLQIEFNEASADKVVVASTGGATLDGTLDVVPVTAGGRYIRGTTQTIIDATAGSQGVGGEFSNAPGPDTNGTPGHTFTADNDSDIAGYSNPLLAVRAIYTDDTVLLKVVRAELFADSGNTPNEVAAGAALDTLQLTTPDGGDMDTVLNELSGVDPSLQGDALNTLTGEVNASIPHGFRDSLRAFDGMLAKRLGGDCNTMNNNSQARAASPYSQAMYAGYQPQPGGRKRAAWLCGYGQFGSRDSDGNASRTDATLVGGAMGMEFEPTRDLQLRLGFGYSNDAIEVADLDKASLNGYQAGIYTQYTFLRHFYIGGGGAGSFNTGNSTRHIFVGGLNRLASGDYDGYALAANGTLGAFTKWGPVNLEAQAGAEYIYSVLNGFTETGAGAADLTVDEKNINTLRGTFGVQASSTFHLTSQTTVTPEIRGAAIYDLFNVAPSIDESFAGTTAAFTAKGANPGRIGYQAGAGMTVNLTSRFSLFGDYNGVYKQHEKSHMVLGGAKLLW